MEAFLAVIGFSNGLVISCVLGGVLGSFANAVRHTINLEGPPRHESELIWASKDLQEKRGAWLFLRCFLGGVIGFVLGLYFVGALHETLGTFAKVVALSIIVGYSAPILLETQERLMKARLASLSASADTKPQAAD